MARALGAVVLFLLGSLGVAGAATAGTDPACDPIYGCEPTTTLAPAVLPECEVSTDSAATGDRVDVTIRNVPEGIEVELLLGGNQVDSEIAGSGATARAAAEPGFADVSFTFVVPALPPGNYTLEATGPAFHCSCLGTTGFGVLGESVVNPPGGNGGGGTGGGSLARTGIAIGLLLALALALLAAGRSLVESGRRTRSAALAGDAPAGPRHGRTDHAPDTTSR